MLPFELIIEILTRLPLTTLLRFRSVCKSWNSLITDPSFALNHLHATSTRRLIFTRPADPYFTDYSLSSAFASTSAAATRLFPSAVPGSHFHHSIVGSCNGLLCLFTVSRNLLLWNPSTGKFRNLPSLEDQRFSVVTSGFGYDHVTHSYKVVVVLYIKNHEFDSRVHTLGSDSWRRIQHFPLSSTACCPGRFVSGMLSWLDKNRFIVSLDLALESYRRISLPDFGGNNTDEFELTLEVFKNSLCVLSCCSHFTDVWIMKDYGIAESWTKLLCVPDLIYYPEFLGFDFNVPRATRAICISDEDDEILLELWLDMEQKFVVYNFSDDSFRPAAIEKFGGRVASEGAVTADILLNSDWEKDLPEDPTGKFSDFKDFVESNFDVCKWIMLVIISAQGLSTIIALVLKAHGPDPNYDSDYDYYTRSRLSLLNHNA